MSADLCERCGAHRLNAALDALFTRVAEAAHELDEEVTCTGGRWDDEREAWAQANAHGDVMVRLSRLPDEATRP
jgi:hypothetical protein